MPYVSNVILNEVNTMLKSSNFLLNVKHKKHNLVTSQSSTPSLLYKSGSSMQWPQGQLMNASASKAITPYHHQNGIFAYFNGRMQR